jgi:uncharacterized protein (DUF2147 family)
MRGTTMHWKHTVSTALASLAGLSMLFGSPVPAEAQQPKPAAAKPNPAFANLRGQWLRAEGGYVIEIKNVRPDGKLDAAYYNPRSIHVARADASHEGGTVKVFIELRDVNYPGSTYTLTYDPARDQLKGRYFQAVARETFDVTFVRLKK